MLSGKTNHIPESVSTLASEAPSESSESAPDMAAAEKLSSAPLSTLRQDYDKLYVEYLKLNLKLKDPDYELGSLLKVPSKELNSSSKNAIRKLYASCLLEHLNKVPSLVVYTVGREDPAVKSLSIKLKHSNGLTEDYQIIPGLKYAKGCSRIEGAFFRAGQITFFLTLGGITTISYTNSQGKDQILRNDTPNFALLDDTSQIVFQDGNDPVLNNSYLISDLFRKNKEEPSPVSEEEILALLKTAIDESYKDASNRINERCGQLDPRVAKPIQERAHVTIMESYQSASYSLVNKAPRLSEVVTRYLKNSQPSHEANNALASGPSALESGSSALASGSYAPASGSSAPASGSSAPASGSSTPASGSSAPASGSSASASGSSASASGSSASEFVSVSHSTYTVSAQQFFSEQMHISQTEDTNQENTGSPRP